MKIATVCVLVAIGLCMVLLFARDCRTHFAVTNYTSSTVTTFHSPDEVFVFIGSGTSVLAESRWYARLRALVGLLPNPTKVKEELLAFHYKDRTLTKSHLESSGFGGSPFVFRNQIYWGRGRLRGRNGPNHWRWDGKKFTAVNEREWAEIDRAIGMEFSLYSEMNAKEGWTEKSLTLAGQESELAFSVQGEQIRLLVKREQLARGQSHVIVKLASASGNRAPDVLVDIVEGYREIQKQEYLKLKKTAATLR